MAAVFVILCSSVVGAEYEVLFRLIGHTLLLKLRSADLPSGLTSWFLGCYIVREAFLIKLLANTQFKYEKF